MTAARAVAPVCITPSYPVATSNIDLLTINIFHLGGSLPNCWYAKWSVHLIWYLWQLHMFVFQIARVVNAKVIHADLTHPSLVHTLRNDCNTCSCPILHQATLPCSDIWHWSTCKQHISSGWLAFQIANMLNYNTLWQWRFGRYTWFTDCFISYWGCHK